jgi:hypothetical protein
MWSTLGMLYFSVQVLKFLGGCVGKGQPLNPPNQHSSAALVTNSRADVATNPPHVRFWGKRTSSLLLTQSGLLPKSPLERFTPQSLWGGAGGDANSSCFSAAWRLRGHLRGTRSSLGNRLITLLPMRAASLRLLAA